MIGMLSKIGGWWMRWFFYGLRPPPRFTYSACDGCTAYTRTVKGRCESCGCKKEDPKP